MKNRSSFLFLLCNIVYNWSTITKDKCSLTVFDIVEFKIIKAYIWSLARIEWETKFGSCLENNIIRVLRANRDHICVVTNIKLILEIHLFYWSYRVSRRDNFCWFNHYKCGLKLYWFSDKNLIRFQEFRIQNYPS